MTARHEEVTAKFAQLIKRVHALMGATDIRVENDGHEDYVHYTSAENGPEHVLASVVMSAEDDGFTPAGSHFMDHVHATE